MWRNYLAVGVRALMKNRVYAFINIVGLAIGMAACLLILVFIRYETSYDRWIPDVANSYQFQSWYPTPRDGQPLFLQMSPYIAAERLQKDFPQVEATVYANTNNPVFVSDGQVSTTENWLFVNGDFLAVVNLPLLRGQRNGLAAVDTAMLTEREAIKRFGTVDVIGQMLTVITKGARRDFRITGVLKNLPRNSALKINALLHIDYAAFMAKEPDFLTCWSCQNGWVWVKLKPGADPAAIEAGLPAWEKRNIPDQSNGEVRTNAGDDEDWHLVNMADVHLGRAQDASMTPGNDRRSIATFAVVALLILGMAVVNFTNLATARAGQRAREVALRKVLGASRGQLIAQFLGESIGMAAVAMLLALALAELALPFFSAFLDADLDLHYLGAGGVLLPVIGLVIVVGLLGGLYPAFYLSRFQPAAVLKANRSAAETAGSGRLRQALVIGQFAVSIGLIACTAVIYGQTVYARSADPGYKRDHILQVDGLSRYQLIGQGEAIAQRMKRLPGVVAVGRTDIGVATDNNSNTGIVVPGNPKPVTIGTYAVDVGLKDTLGLEMKAGRWFDENRPADDTTQPFPVDPVVQKRLAARGVNVVMNDLAVKKLGFASPADAIGKTVRGVIFADDVGQVPITIIGVMKNSRFRSVRTPIDALFFIKVRESPTTLVVRYRGDPVAVRDRVEAAWRSFNREVPFEARFSEDIIGDLYRADDARAELFAAFSLLAVVIGCLGLFGLASFTAERRTKEIGIRKVLGARTRDIVRLLIWQFSRPVLIANLIAWPIAWFVMRRWLNGFDTRITLGPLPFVAAGALALAIAIATIAAQSFKVARAHPIRALRYE